jgi:hypothetical protein
MAEKRLTQALDFLYKCAIFATPISSFIPAKAGYGVQREYKTLLVNDLGDQVSYPPQADKSKSR